ncbi:MAG: hypothetical protein ACP5OG_01205 [Candidatus Nanoarchaeia archaeon]
MPPVYPTARAIEPMVRQGIGKIMDIGIGTEVIYSFVIIICSLMIYFATKELYNLTKHKGIKYFRMGFLFFALAYFFRSFIKFIFMTIGIDGHTQFSRTFFGGFSFMFFMYFSSMAIFYIIYSVVSKRFENKEWAVYILHSIAIAIALIVALFRNPIIVLIINFIFFIAALLFILIAYHESKNKKKGLNLYAIYSMLFIFFILNIIDALVPTFLQTYQLIIYLFSTTIFLLILYKVLTKVGSY